MPSALAKYSGRSEWPRLHSAHRRLCWRGFHPRRTIATFATASCKAESTTRTRGCSAAWVGTPACSPRQSIWHDSPNACLAGGCGLIRRETIELFTTQDQTFRGSTRFGLGWDKPTPPSQAGQHFSSRSFGHLGFTGTSLWIDPEKQLAIILLSNRTWPDRSSQVIKEVRPKFHDAVVEALRAEQQL